jgi:hypothetical protein
MHAHVHTRIGVLGGADASGAAGEWRRRRILDGNIGMEILKSQIPIEMAI